MPENEKPPAMRVDIYYAKEKEDKRKTCPLKLFFNHIRLDSTGNLA